MTQNGLTRVGLVGCGAAKLTHPAPARDLYTSTLFRKTSTYADTTCDRWYVLSAAHGLVHPDAVLEPYDVTLGTSASSAPQIVQWADDVVRQLEAALADLEHPLLVILAGARYRTILDRSAWPHATPLKGLGIGQQLAWLTRELATSRPQASGSDAGTARP